MNRRLKLAIAALLGFSTACSTAKQAPRTESDEPAVTPSYRSERQIRVMYGTRPPQPRVEAQLPDSAALRQEVQPQQPQQPAADDQPQAAEQ